MLSYSIMLYAHKIQSTKSVSNSRVQSALFCHEEEAQGLYFDGEKAWSFCSVLLCIKHCSATHSNSLVSG